eukprot:gene2434-biopygen5830
MCTVRYPAARSTCATPVSLAERMGPLERTVQCPECRPVINVHRLGAQTGAPAY